MEDELTLKAAEDARLLDAARDMLEALKLAMRIMSECCGNFEHTCIKKGRAAIAKAEGKQ